MSASSKNPYLHEFEPQQVLALIAHLATSRSPGGHTPAVIAAALPMGDRGRDWLTIAREHSEFFGVIGQEDTLRLSARFDQPAAGGRPVLEPTQIFRLQEIAVKSHEAACRLEEQRSKRTALIVTSIASLIVGALGSDLLLGWIKGLVTR